MDFSSRLLSWYSRHQRPLPWRGSKDPYRIWISEIILQQTRIDQGLAYYMRFLEAFPSVYALAAAPEEQVLRMWQGLGYYSRARNMHATAIEIVRKRLGRFPQNYQDWVGMKGVGPYTAAAIASIAFGEVVPALDGNAYRVLTRLFGIELCIDTLPGKNAVFEIAQDLIDQNDPGGFNQALMDFGSQVCKPANPSCTSCMFARECLAYTKGAVTRYPVRKPRTNVKARYFNYAFIYSREDNGTLWFCVQQRLGNDIWKHLYEWPMLESGQVLQEDRFVLGKWWLDLLPDPNGYVLKNTTFNFIHKLTHQTIYAKIYLVETAPTSWHLFKNRYLVIQAESFRKLAKPVLIDNAFQRIMAFLNE